VISLIIGCKVLYCDNKDYFTNIEMTANSYPTIEQSKELALYLNETTEHFIDEVVYVMDALDGSIIWQRESK